MIFKINKEINFNGIFIKDDSILITNAKNAIESGLLFYSITNVNLKLYIYMKKINHINGSSCRF